MKKSLISVKNLCVGTNDKDILKNISFEVCDNEIVCIIGQSGSGKTITSYAILDILPENIIKKSGNILYDGMPFSDNIYGNYISTIMQLPASCFDGVFTIREQVKDILKANNQEYNYNKLSKLLKAVGLNDVDKVLSSYPFQLSGGMMQRVSILVSLIINSKIIIADEPTSNLDSKGEKEILDLLLKLKSKGKSILFITHNLSAAKKIADRVLVMHNGEIVDNFLIDNIEDDIRHIYTKQLINANKNLYTNLWNIQIGEQNAKM